MINPSNVTIDTEEQRLWLIDHKASTGMSWSQLEKPIDVNGKTLGLFSGGKYAGDNQRIADCIFRYRQNLSAQAQIKIEAPDIPPYFETRTSQEIQHILAWAHRGRMTLFAGGPGTSKTITANEYRERVSNAWIVTMCPSIKTVQTMTLKVLRAMGDTSARINYLLSSYVRGKFKDRQGVLIIDEAQHLNVELIEELRNWHDETGVGLAFLGNEQIVARMEGGSRQAEFAQLYSRVSLRLIRPIPLKEDIEALADAWQIQDEEVFAFILRIGRKPGGMRSCTFTLELAKMIAESQSAELSLAHVTAAWNQLSTRPIAA